jgi:EAL domain-containing protein (putative c-di-GMP-specific phosphodiesterase class I)
MITVYSSVLSLCSYIILDEFMISNIEVDDLKRITVENIIENTSAFSINSIQFVSRGIKKYEQARNLQTLGVIAISGTYVLEPTSDLNGTSFLKNRTIQRLYEHQ